MYRKVETLAHHGLTGIDRSELGGSVRSFSYRERIIFFNVSETELTVLRVAHGHQDISPDYFKTDEN
jgi:plasmid stabilization system protein ParE